MTAKVQIFLFKNFIRIVTYDGDIDEPLYVSSHRIDKRTLKKMRKFIKEIVDITECVSSKEFHKLNSEVIGLMTDLDLLFHDETHVDRM